MKHSVKLKKLKRGRKKIQWDLQKLEEKVESFQNKVNETIRDNKQDDVSIEGRWKMLRKAVLEAAKTEVGYKMGTEARKPSVTDKMIKKSTIALCAGYSVIKVQTKRSTAHINVFFECSIKTMNVPSRYCLPAVLVFAFMQTIYRN